MTSAAMQLQERGPIQPEGALAGRVLRVWMRVRDIWAKLPTRQRAWALAAALLTMALLAALSWEGLSTDWRVLYSGLDPEDARQVALALTQGQIPFDLTDNGMTLRVPSPLLDKARLATSAKAIKSGRMAFELFDKPNWVGSEFDQQVNYQRALEGELEHTVSSLADIETARVHLVMPHDSIFRDQQRPAKASVVLKLRHASLADGEAEAIRNLVSSAVDGLLPDHVVLVDASGRLPLGPRTQDSLRMSAEQALENKIISTIGAVAGPENVRATVTLDYDQDSSEETSETYDPEKYATLSMERTEQTSGEQVLAAGVPGTASNVPNAQSLPVYPKQTAGPQASKTETGTYGVSKTVRHKVENPGRVRRMTAAVVVNDRHDASPNKDAANQVQPRSAEELRKITLLSEAALGFDAARGDVVTVQAISFEEERDLPAASFAKRALSTIQEWPEGAKYLSLLLAVFIIVIFGLRPAIRQLTRRQDPEVSQSKLESPLRTPLPSAIVSEQTVPDRTRTQELLERVSEQMKKEPTLSSRLLQSWIHSD